MNLQCFLIQKHWIWWWGGRKKKICRVSTTSSAIFGAHDSSKQWVFLIFNVTPWPRFKRLMIITGPAASSLLITNHFTTTGYPAFTARTFKTVGDQRHQVVVIGQTSSLPWSLKRLPGHCLNTYMYDSSVWRMLVLSSYHYRILIYIVHSKMSVSCCWKDQNATLQQVKAIFPDNMFRSFQNTVKCETNSTVTICFTIT